MLESTSPEARQRIHCADKQLLQQSMMSHDADSILKFAPHSHSKPSQNPLGLIDTSSDCHAGADMHR